MDNYYPFHDYARSSLLKKIEFDCRKLGHYYRLIVDTFFEQIIHLKNTLFSKYNNIFPNNTISETIDSFKDYFHNNIFSTEAFDLDVFTSIQNIQKILLDKPNILDLLVKNFYDIHSFLISNSQNYTSSNLFPNLIDLIEEMEICKQKQKEIHPKSVIIISIFINFFPELESTILIDED